MMFFPFPRVLASHLKQLRFPVILSLLISTWRCNLQNCLFKWGSRYGSSPFNAIFSMRCSYSCWTNEKSHSSCAKLCIETLIAQSKHLIEILLTDVMRIMVYVINREQWIPIRINSNRCLHWLLLTMAVLSNSSYCMIPPRCYQDNI